MIHCLHGAVGMAQDWDLFPHHEGVDLWALLENGELSLAEAGRKIAQRAQDGDTLIGYSMGGRLALHALLSGECAWKEAVIISAHPGLREGHAERLAADAHWADFAETHWADFLEKWNAQAILGRSALPWPSRDALKPRRLEVARSFRCWSLGAQEDLRPRLAEITCPVRWIAGEQDEKFTRLAQEAVALLPQGRLEIIPDVGHRVPWECPAAL